MHHMPKSWIAVVVAALLVMFALWVWPGLYIYKTQSGRVVRINRITQDIAVIQDGGWYTLRPFSRSPSPPEKKPAADEAVPAQPTVVDLNATTKPAAPLRKTLRELLAEGAKLPPAAD